MTYQGKIEQSTQVTYPGGALSHGSKVIAIADVPNFQDCQAVFVEKTPFHPVDYNWPDQPADRGALKHANGDLPLTHCIIAAWDQTNDQLYFDQAIPVKRGKQGWCFLVAHLVNKGQLTKTQLAVGDQVTLNVDPEYREALSQGHTLCHLAALALNRSTQTFWRKTPDCFDAMEHPDLDGMAIQQSQIKANASYDVYRLGKSLQKKGFNRHQFYEQADTVQHEIEQHLNRLATSGVKIAVKPENGSLEQPRYWYSESIDGEANIPCGGTHPRFFGGYKAKQNVSVQLDFNNDGNELTMQCSLQSKQPGS